MAERSKALVLGTSLFGGVGSNPTPIKVPVSLVGQDTWFSPMRPGFESRTGNVFLPRFFFAPLMESGCTAPAMSGMSRLAQLVERKTLNLVVVGSSPTVGVTNF